MLVVWMPTTVAPVIRGPIDRTRWARLDTDSVSGQSKLFTPREREVTAFLDKCSVDCDAHASDRPGPA